MKRTLAFVISFTFSFMFFFSSMAMAEEVQTPMPQVTSKLTDSEILLPASSIKASSENLFNIGKELNAKLLMDVNREEPVSSFSEICPKGQLKCPLSNGEIGYCLSGTCSPGATLTNKYERFLTRIYSFLSTLWRFFGFSQ
ncbi:hypothetical protein [Anabaena azotica]|uniref:Uncharacterized protein n=1 Tax=Anabaena azotica FACHB-119 TaxID=947527 RepID=A0ABR8D0R1_9NOST|nr:hypothetical protein [Anabaena azotica]MBD2499991.1 hypothetical protein [Anabaena azotica FACHB-119]